MTAPQLGQQPAPGSAAVNTTGTWSAPAPARSRFGPSAPGPGVARRIGDSPVVHRRTLLQWPFLPSRHHSHSMVAGGLELMS